jgi:hypothetical protein
LPPVLFTPSDRALGRGEYRSAIEITLDKSLELAGLASTINKVVDFILFFLKKRSYAHGTTHWQHAGELVRD